MPKLFNIAFYKLDTLVDEKGINLVALFDKETGELIDDYDVGSPEYAERAEWFVKGEHFIEDKEIDGKTLKVLKIYRLEPTIEITQNPIEVKASEDVEYPLPSDPEEQRKALIDLEDNVGVILRIEDDKAIVRPYKREGEAIPELEKPVTVMVLHKPSMKWFGREARVMDVLGIANACVESMQRVEPETKPSDFAIITIDWDARNVKIESIPETE